jgi:DNA-binding IclR family transcriptional regulator
MATPVPAIDRALRIMALLSSSPGRAYTSSEIANALDIPKGSCFSLLMSLGEADFLTRDPVKKTYQLGPSCLTLSESFLRSFSGLRDSRTEIAKLSVELGFPCIVTAPVLDEIITLATSGSPVLNGRDVLPGNRSPLVPPLGTVFLAWSTHERFEQWRSHLSRNGDEDRLASYQEAIDLVRSRGYSVGRPAASGEMTDWLIRYASAASGHERHQVAAQFLSILREDAPPVLPAAQAGHMTQSVTAPVYDRAGHTELAVTLVGPFDETQTAVAIGKLLEVTIRITRNAGGIVPGNAS